MFEASNVVHSESRSNKAKRVILEYLDEYKEVRATKLKKEVCDEQGVCSEKIFYRCLSELVESKLIIKNEQNRGNVSYFRPSWAEYENRVDALRTSQAATTIKILNEAGSVESLGWQFMLFKAAFSNIIDMYAGLMLGKMLQKKTSAVITNTLEMTIPELVKIFEDKLEKCGKNKFTLLSSLIADEEQTIGAYKRENERMVNY